MNFITPGLSDVLEMPTNKLDKFSLSIIDELLQYQRSRIIYTIKILDKDVLISDGNSLCNWESHRLLEDVIPNLFIIQNNSFRIGNVKENTTCEGGTKTFARNHVDTNLAIKYILKKLEYI